MRDVLHYLISLFTFDSSHPLLFTQIHFWVFLLVVYAGFCLLCVGRTFTAWRRVARNAYLFAVSLLFYYKTQGWFVLLLVASTLLGYLLGIGMDRHRSRPLARLYCTFGVVANLAVLCYFKYAYFFTDVFNATFGTSHSIASAIILPVGISFFTFQNISYIVDVYRGRIAHVSNVLDFGFYTAFFPQLVAGPILRADQFVPQLYKPFHLSRRQFGIAVFWIVNGLVKKLVLSDYLAVSFVDRVFDNPVLYTPFENFSALLLYSLQVYADFSGYTDIAIGVAMLMGFYLPVNFRSPYKATNPSDFWHRWHISLSNWLRDYVYIPLGGNRRGHWYSYLILFAILAMGAFRAGSVAFAVVVAAVAVALLLALAFSGKERRRRINTNVNNMDTMLLGGLWHGASMNFITWGGLNGLGILVHKWWKRRGWPTQIAVVVALAVALRVLKATVGGPLLSMLSFIASVMAVAITLLNLLPQTRRWVQGLWLVWDTGLTFVFISFTRLFFRSGSNLDPAEANEVAWRTASQMVGQIGRRWDLAVVPDILANYWPAFLVFAIGMAVHWLPERFKRRYRLWFAAVPLWLLPPLVAAVVVVLFQFVTADLQPFIYFQF